MKFKIGIDGFIGKLSPLKLNFNYKWDWYGIFFLGLALSRATIYPICIQMVYEARRSHGPSNGARGHKFTSTIRASFLLNTLIKGYRLRPEVLEPVA